MRMRYWRASRGPLKISRLENQAASRKAGLT
jgi:hypothetical protein